MATQYSANGIELPAAPSRDGESIRALLRRLMDELATLFRQEVALATAEVSGALTRMLLGMTSVATGAAVLYAGFLVLLAAAVLGLATMMSPWLAALVVGLVASVIGLGMVYGGRKAFDPTALKPRRTVESLRQDKETLTRKQS
jgi:hypothetical protein